MGQISGVDAALITNIAGVTVANISYVGPTSAASIGLGGGGGDKIFTTLNYTGGEEACYTGPGVIAKGGRNIQTLYQAGEFFYTDSGFTTPFDGGGNWWYDGTDNISYQIGNEGNTMSIFNCG